MGKHPACIGSEQGQELVLCGGKFKQLVSLSHRSGCKIYEQIAGGNKGTFTADGLFFMADRILAINSAFRKGLVR